MKKTIIRTLSGALAIVAISMTSCSSDAASAKEPAKATESAKVEETKEAPKASSPWNYNEDVDKMDNKKSFFAQTQSTNQVEFEFPYNGGSTFTLYVRNKANKNEVFIMVDKGQFMPSLTGERTVRLKFDDAAPMNVSYTGTTDASSNIIFLASTNKVLPKLKAAKKLMVEAEFFNAGKHVLEFNVEGLNWSH